MMRSVVFVTVFLMAMCFDRGVVAQQPRTSAGIVPIVAMIKKLYTRPDGKLDLYARSCKFYSCQRSPDGQMARSCSFYKKYSKMCFLCRTFLRPCKSSYEMMG